MSVWCSVEVFALVKGDILPQWPKVRKPCLGKIGGGGPVLNADLDHALQIQGWDEQVHRFGGDACLAGVGMMGRTPGFSDACLFVSNVVKYPSSRTCRFWL